MARFSLTDLLGAAGEEENKELPKIEYIDIDQLIPSEENFYKIDDVQELKESIEMVGIKQNLLVASTGDGNYKILAGHRRRKAIKELVAEGKEELREVPCIVDYSNDKEKQELFLIMTNSTVRELSDWEKIEQVKRLKPLLQQYKKEHGIKGRVRKMTAEALGVSVTQIGRMESIDKNLSSEFKEEFRKGNVNISTVYEVSKLPKENQKHMFDKHKKTGKTTITEAQEYREAMRRREKAGQTIIADLTDVPIGWDLPEEEPESLTNFQKIMQNEVKVKEIIVNYMKAKCDQCPCETENCVVDCAVTIWRWLEAVER